MSEHQDYLYRGFLKIQKRIHRDRAYEVLEISDGVAAWVMDTQNRVLLVQQYRPAVQRLTWEIPAGLMDKPGKDKKQVLVEELKEECHLRVDRKDLHFFCSFVPQIGHNYSHTHIYQLQLDGILETERDVDDLDVERTRWWTLEALGKAIDAGELVDGKTVLAFYAYMRKESK